MTLTLIRPSAHIRKIHENLLDFGISEKSLDSGVEAEL
jgi:hypothetical protein